MEYVGVAMLYGRGGQPFQNEGHVRLCGVARGPKPRVTNENTKMRMSAYILQYFYCKAGKSMRRLVLLAMKEYVNVRPDG